jgi:hypothetical protein
MKNPDNIHDALRQLNTLLAAAGNDLERYLESPSDISLEYFEVVKGAVLDARLLVTWIRDNFIL